MASDTKTTPPTKTRRTEWWPTFHQQKKDWLLAVGLSLCTLVVLLGFNLTRPLGNFLYDAMLLIEGPPSSSQVRVIAIDDKSLQELGQWPLNRDYYKQLLERLAGDECKPSVIGFDLFFTAPSSHDAALGQAMRQHRVVVPLEFQPSPKDNTVDLEVRPVPQIASAASWGHVNLTFRNEGGALRGIQTHHNGWPQLALQIGNIWQGKTDFSKPQYKRVRFFGIYDTWPTESLVDVLKASCSELAHYSNKLVLIGVTASGLGSRYPTLYASREDNNTPGVAILASIAHASLNNALIQIAPTTHLLLLSMPLMALMLACLLLLSPRSLIVLCLVISLFTLMGSFAWLHWFHYWTDPSALVAILLLTPALWNLRRLEKTLVFVHKTTKKLTAGSDRGFSLQPEDHSAIFDSMFGSTLALDAAIQSAQTDLNFLSRVIDEMPDAVFLFNPEDKLILTNRLAKILFDETTLEHTSPSQFLSLIGAPTAFLLATHSSISTSTASVLKESGDSPPLSNSEVEQPAEVFGQTIGSGQIVQVETMQGSRNFYIKFAEIKIGFDQLLRLIILVDVSELKQYQTQRNRALQFLSHDMRTPLASIVSLARRQDTGEASNEPELRSKIINHASALLEMTEDFILTVSAESASYQMRDELLENLVNDAIERVHDLAEAKHQTIEENMESSHLFILADSRLFVRALVNILSNAIKFAPAHSTIYIAVEAIALGSNLTGDHAAVIKVQNVVDPQFSAIKNTQAEGFGIGLEFVQTVIRKHRGYLSKSTPHIGNATVTLVIPCNVHA